MDNAELLSQVRRLRDQGAPPKQIARVLGLTPAAVTPLIRAVAAQRAAATEPPLVGCWINTGWSVGLSIDPARGWTDEHPSPDGTDGLASVLVARQHRWQDAPIELARHVVCGAVDYAHSLGFPPAAAFTHSAAHLGCWQGPSAITFGRNGKPLYTSGPRDNPHQVIATLQRTVGAPPNFDYIVAQPL